MIEGSRVKCRKIIDLPKTTQGAHRKEWFGGSTYRAESSSAAYKARGVEV